MSLAQTFKAGSKMAALGLTGIGGIGATVWGLGSAGAGNEVLEEDEIELLFKPVPKKVKKPLDPKEKERIRNRRYHAAYEFFKFNPKDAGRARDWNEFTSGFPPDPLKYAHESDKTYWSTQYFGVMPTKCFQQTFPGVTMHNERNFQIDPNKKPYKDSLKISLDPRPSEYGPVEGCYSILVTRQINNYFLTSEISMKVGDRGISIWTGSKNGHAYMPSSLTDQFPVQARNYMVFLERDNSTSPWKIKGGYSWGGRGRLFYLRSLTLQSPGGIDFNEYFHRTTVGLANRDSRFYYANWKEDPAESDHPITLKPEWYPNRDHFTLIPDTVYGYGTVDTFLDLENMDKDTRPWKQYCPEDTRSNCGHKILSLNVKDAIDAWTTPFTTSEGIWESPEKNR